MTSSILSELDWDDGLAIPVSNAENKRLEEELTQLQHGSDEFEREVIDNDDHIHYMSQHHKNVHQELMHTVALYKALTNDFETEAHMYAISDREEGRMNQEIARYDKEMIHMREKKNNMENQIYSDTQQIEVLKAQMNWSEQALEAWLEESARRDDDAMTLQKYSDEDNSRLKSLTLHIEHLVKESQQKRKCLDHEMLETLIAQIELDRTAEEFRETHKQRHQLISLWENTIEQMKKRDAEMDESANYLAEVKQDMMQYERMIKEKENFLHSEIYNNTELDRNIQSEERLTAKLRNDLFDHENVRTQLENDLDTLRYTVARTATDNEGLRSVLCVLKKDLASLGDKFRADKKLKRELQKKLELTEKDALTAEEKAKFASKLLAEEEQVIKDMTKLISKNRDYRFKKKQDVMKEETVEKNIVAEIQGTRAACRNLCSRLKKLGQHSIKQQEIIYNQDFNIQQLERRMSRMQGEINAFERNQLQAKIAKLVETLEKKETVRVVLNSQLKRIQDDVRRQKRDLETVTATRDGWYEKLETLELNIEIASKELKTATKRKQSSMVDENILKVRIRRVRGDLNKRAGNVLSLEMRKEKLNAALKERKAEIAVHKHMLFGQLKHAEEEKSAVNAELHLRTEKISKLRNRFEILTISMAPPEGEEHQSQAYYVIKAAQEKEELQRKGDDLDARISKAEKEIRALENTLKLLNSRNHKIRQNLNKVTESSEEFELKRKLDDQLHSMMEKYKYKRRQIRELQDDLRILSTSMDALMRDESELAEMMEGKESKVHQLKAELEEQSDKLNRVYKQVFRVAREARQAKGERQPLFEERDIELRNAKSQNKGLVKMMIEALQQFPDVLSAMQQYFLDARFSFPDVRTSSRSSSSTGSSQSSTKSTPRRVSSGSGRSTAMPKTVDLGLGLRLISSPRPRPQSQTSSRSSARSDQSSPARKTR